MSRYLTPSKISLLVLISLYVDDVVPTASTIPILSFVLSHLLPLNAGTSAGSSRKPALQIEDFEKATASHASIIPGRNIWDLLLKRLWEINTFDTLHVFFDSLIRVLPRSPEELTLAAEDPGLLDGPRMRLARTSPLGAFVRRAQLEFGRLPFGDGAALWKAFVVYRGPTFAGWRRRHAATAAPGLSRHDAQLVGCANPDIDALLYGDVADVVLRDAGASTDDLEALLEFQIDQMQKFGHRIPDDMKQRLEEMSHAGITKPSLSHYVRFLDSWKAGDYSAAFEHLHRYFDYTMRAGERKFYQYALLNLAILQADFGCFAEAVAAMHESVASAREDRDAVCLNYALSWAYHFGKAHPREIADARRSGVLGSDKEALSFLKAKAKETGMWSLLSTSFLGEAKMGLTNGESVAAAFEAVVKSSHLNVVKGIPGAVGSQMIVESSLYSRLGLGYLAWTRNELFLECYAHRGSLEDTLQFKCREALFLAAKGQFKEALAAMDEVSADTLRTLKYQQYWMAYMGLLKLRHAIYRGHLEAVDAYLAQLRANPPLNHDIAHSTACLAVELHLRRREHPAAMAAVDAQLQRAHPADGSGDSRSSNSKSDGGGSPTAAAGGSGDAYHAVQLLALKARVWDAAGAPHKGFSAALRAAALALRALFLPALWEALCALARVLGAGLREHAAAAALLRAVLPALLEAGDAALAARAYAGLADAYAGLAGAAGSGSARRREQLARALECLERAFDAHSRVGDVQGQCEVMAKRATVMHVTGDLVLANDYAAKYLDLQRAAREEIAA